MSDPSSLMMESSVLVQCLEFSRLLISNQKAFQFEVKLASGFSFNFNTLDQEPTKSRTQEVRKKSPSTLKRNAARKEKFLQDKKPLLRRKPWLILLTVTNANIKQTAKQA